MRTTCIQLTFALWFIFITCAITRLALYGFDLGLLSVWFGDLPMDWPRTMLDFVAGYSLGSTFKPMHELWRNHGHSI